MASTEALVLSTVLFAWAIGMRTVTGTWLQPGAFFSLFWCFAGILPLILAPQEPVGANAILWLIASSIVVSVGSVAGNGGFKTRRLSLPAPATDRELLIFGGVLIATMILGMGSNLVFLQSSAISFGDLLDIEKLVVVSNQGYVERFDPSGGTPPPRLAQALLPFVYLAPAIGGILFELRREARWKILALGSFLPAVAVTVLQTTKAATLFAIILWLSTYFAARLRNGKLSVFTKGHLMVALIVGSVLMTFFFAVGLARLATTDVSLINVVMLKLLTSAFGHMTVFSQWLTEYTSTSFEPSMGKVTFAGPLELFGYSQRIPGLFDSIVELIAGESSNIYTAFRPLIQDFSIPGALVVMTALGFIGGVGFRLVSLGRWSAVPLLVTAYVTIFWTPITWFWIYNSLTATVVAVGLIVFFVRVWRGSYRGSIQGEQVAGTT